jgi:hypothetical protein
MNLDYSGQSALFSVPAGIQYLEEGRHLNPLIRYIYIYIYIYEYIHNPSSPTMAPGLTQPLTEFSIRNLLEGKGRTASKADSLTAICEPIV